MDWRGISVIVTGACATLYAGVFVGILERHYIITSVRAELLLWFTIVGVIVTGTAYIAGIFEEN